MIRRHHTARITGKEGRANMMRLLYGCKVEMLPGMSAEKLVATYPGVKLEEAEYELAMARQRRADHAVQP